MDKQLGFTRKKWLHRLQVEVERRTVIGACILKQAVQHLDHVRIIRIVSVFKNTCCFIALTADSVRPVHVHGSISFEQGILPVPAVQFKHTRAAGNHTAIGRYTRGENTVKAEGRNQLRIRVVSNSGTHTGVDITGFSDIIGCAQIGNLKQTQ